MKRIGLFIVSFCLFFFSAWADGTRQLWPNTAAEGATPNPKAGIADNQCFLALGSREGGNGDSRPFARYQHTTKESCSLEHRLYFRIKDGETLCLGFGDYTTNGGKTGYKTDGTSSSTTGRYPRHKGKKDMTNYDYGNVKYRISKGLGATTVVYGGGADGSGTTLPSYGEEGYIKTYAEAYYGPNIIDVNGYEPIVISAATLGGAGDYFLEFDIGSDFDIKDGVPFDIQLFDITVVNGSNKPQSGRVWSNAWGLTTNGDTKQVWATFYTMSTDGYLSKVYMSGAQPYRFVFGCNSFGATREYENKPNGVEKDRQSYPNKNTFTPEYKVFLTRPDDDFEGQVAQVPNIPKDLTFAGDAMSCEDLLFVVQLLYNEDATIELLMDTNEDGEPDMIIADKLLAEKSKSRGYHYPWKDKDAIKEAGEYWYYPEARMESGCLKQYKLSLFDQRFTFVGLEVEDDKKCLNIGDSIDCSAFSAQTGASITLDDVKNDLSSGTLTFREPLGSANNPVLIRNKKDLEDLADAVNTGGEFTYTIPDFLIDKATGEKIPATFTLDGSYGFYGVNFYLIAPTGTITLDSDWEGIGNVEDNLPFKGIFRAGRYAPNPLTDNTEESYAKQTGDQDTITFEGASVGLFAYCDGATIDNVNIKGDISYGSYTVKEKMENYDGTINTCIVMGGICSYMKNSTIKHCSNACVISGDIMDDQRLWYVGGIAGYANMCEIDSCRNYAEINISENVEESTGGGIVGAMQGTSLINYSYNLGKISSYYAAGILGAEIDDSGSGNVTITNCKNKAWIIGDATGAGIVGFNMGKKLLIEDCENNGSIEGQWTRGILGEGERTDIRYCLDTYDEGIAGTEPTIAQSISVADDGSSIEYYNNGTTKDYDDLSTVDGLTLEPGVTLDEDHFYYNEEDGTYSLYETMCCGENWRMESAGRLYKDDQSFYIKWDGKDSDGNCVVGEVTVKYQKNSGVTHFPFFDPENMNLTESRTGGLKGLVVYRISPIQDSIKKYDDPAYWASAETDGVNGASKNQRAERASTDADTIALTANAKSRYGYQKLPEGYYQTVNLSDDEYGIEMNLYWDDRKIIINNTTCDKTVTETTPPLVIGKTTTETTYTYINRTKNTRRCDMRSGFSCVAPQRVINTYKSPKSGDTLYYCTKSNGQKFGNECSVLWYDTTWNTTTTYVCSGIENVSAGGYLGSKGGGHIFPEKNFGNTHTINTWWNGVEVQSLNILNMKEHSVASLTVYMPIVISLWEATNLDNSVLLEWSTASEENNDYFTIERSFNGVSWVAIGKVNGAGTTTVENYYSFEDKKPVEGISYYRLKQTDYNGDYSYSSVKCINRPTKANDSFVVYTNHDVNAFIVEGEVIAACPIEVYSTTGARIYNVSFNTISVNKVLINVKDLPAGSYFVKICNGSKAVIKNW